MKRIIEWLLAGIGALMCLSGAVRTWLSQAAFDSPGVSLWPLPALILIEVAIFGIAGFAAVVLDNNQHSSRWGSILWIACGGLMALAITGAFSVSVLGLLVVPAMLFSGAAILADGRRHRNMLRDLGLFSLSAVANFLLIFILIRVVRI